jgi:hypothetical protein
MINTIRTSISGGYEIIMGRDDCSNPIVEG